MNLSDAGFELIRSFEGYHTALPDGSCKAYLDTLAKPHIWTIGYGVTEGVTSDMVLTKEQAEAMFRRELEKHEAIVNRLVTVEIGQSNFDALVSFQYNTGGLPGSTLLKKLNKGDFDGAAKCFDSWNKAGGKVIKGLVRRRAAERAMFEQDAKDPAIPVGQPDMPQQVDQPGQVSMGKLTAALTPPTAISAGLTIADSWQSIGDRVAGHLQWAIGKPVALAVIALTIAVYWLIPKRST
jgi:lysozyme